jgi:hypothetical protein
MRKKVDLMEALHAMAQGKNVIMMIPAPAPNKMSVQALMEADMNDGALFFMDVQEEEKPKRTKGEKIDDDKILALRKADWTLESIAYEVGVCTQTVANRLKKMGYEKNAGEDS